MLPLWETENSNHEFAFFYKEANGKNTILVIIHIRNKERKSSSMLLTLQFQTFPFGQQSVNNEYAPMQHKFHISSSSSRRLNLLLLASLLVPLIS